MLHQPDAKPLNASTNLLATLPPIESDSLLALIAAANADDRPHKIDVGVGVYRDGGGATPIPRALKEAERRLWESQRSKSYLGGRGNVGFAAALAPLLLGPQADDPRIDGLQTPGGCGALVLAFRLIAAANPRARVLVGTPTWPNHAPIIAGSGLEVVGYPYYDRDRRRLNFDVMMTAIGKAQAGDVVLLHGCCHNPTGADLDDGQWRDVAAAVALRGLLPVIDIAYQGLGRGFEEDAAGTRLVVEACDEAIVAQSCDKNFGVYRDRVGSLWLKTASAATSAMAMKHVLQIAREMWSMPPDHGAAAVAIVLEDEALRADWLAQVGDMRDRINRIRARIAAADPRLAYIAGQFGMFSMLPFSPAQVAALRERDAIHMADSGRFNVVGMADEAVDRFIAAVVGALDG